MTIKGKMAVDNPKPLEKFPDNYLEEIEELTGIKPVNEYEADEFRGWR